MNMYMHEYTKRYMHTYIPEIHYARYNFVLKSLIPFFFELSILRVSSWNFSNRMIFHERKTINFSTSQIKELRSWTVSARES